MNDEDRRLLETLAADNPELARLLANHQAYEDQLEELGGRRYLSDGERLEMARLKKEKLRGKDRIHQILAEARRPASS
jgi:uncharacterized protein YdcH (DUF465 family)